MDSVDSTFFVGHPVPSPLMTKVMWAARGSRQTGYSCDLATQSYKSQVYLGLSYFILILLKLLFDLHIYSILSLFQTCSNEVKCICDFDYTGKDCSVYDPLPEPQPPDEQEEDKGC